jgi:hypothetical protein
MQRNVEDFNALRTLSRKFVPVLAVLFAVVLSVVLTVVLAVVFAVGLAVVLAVECSRLWSQFSARGGVLPKVGCK